MIAPSIPALEGWIKIDVLLLYLPNDCLYRPVARGDNNFVFLETLWPFKICSVLAIPLINGVDVLGKGTRSLWHVPSQLNEYVRINY